LAIKPDNHNHSFIHFVNYCTCFHLFRLFKNYPYTDNGIGINIDWNQRKHVFELVLNII